METYKATPRIDYDQLTFVYETIFDNAGLEVVGRSFKNKNKITVVDGEYSVFLSAYQSCNLATPLCYELEPFDGKKFKVFYRGECKIEVEISSKVN